MLFHDDAFNDFGSGLGRPRQGAEKGLSLPLRNRRRFSEP
jgi:hypothetical protein